MPKTPREVFLEEIGHQVEEDHRRVNVYAGEPERSLWLGAAMRAAAALIATPGCEPFSVSGGVPNYCGWWWCSEPDAVTSWADLRQALSVLKNHELDPKGLAGSQIAELFAAANWSADQRDDLEQLRAMLSRPLSGSAEFHRLKFLEELAVPLEQARAAKPDKEGPRGPGRPIENHPLNTALRFAETLGWQAEDVAAIMLLVGVDRSTWASLRDRVRKAYGRTKIAVVP